MLDEDYNFFLKNENINTDSESISGFNENASTYMGVKTIQEGTIPDTDKKEMKMRRSQKKKKAKKNKKKRKKKIIIIFIKFRFVFLFIQLIFI